MNIIRILYHKDKSNQLNLKCVLTYFTGKASILMEYAYFSIEYRTKIMFFIINFLLPGINQFFMSLRHLDQMH